MRLDHKIAVVTGGASGMGKAICQTFAQRGATVIVADIQEGQAAAVAAQIVESGGKASAIRADVTDEADVQHLVAETLQSHGRLDVLISNAGARLIKPFIDHTKEDWDRMLTVNLSGHFFCAKAVAPVMLKQEKGKIVINGSIASFIGRPNRVAYCAAKAGLLGLTRAMAIDLRHRNICVNMLAPGSIATPLNMEAAEDRNTDWGGETLVGRWGNAEDVAQAALFLASEESNYVTGAEIKVDGGWLAARARHREI